MNNYVLDTMALVLLLENRKVPKPLKQLFKRFRNQSATFIIPAICISEVGYLSEKGRILTSIKDIEEFCNYYSNCKIQELNLSINKIAFQLQGIPELHDRLIAATAVFLNSPLLTNDAEIIENTEVDTLWN